MNVIGVNGGQAAHSRGFCPLILLLGLVGNRKREMLEVKTLKKQRNVQKTKTGMKHDGIVPQK